MDINSLTIGEAREIAQLFNASQAVPVAVGHPYEIGKHYFVRTVTMTLTGHLKAVYPTELVLTDAAWIADSGRFADALKTSEFSEVEPFPDGDCIIGRGAIVDACQIKPFTRSQK